MYPTLKAELERRKELERKETERMIAAGRTCSNCIEWAFPPRGSRLGYNTHICELKSDRYGWIITQPTSSCPDHEPKQKRIGEL